MCYYMYTHTYIDGAQVSTIQKFHSYLIAQRCPFFPGQVHRREYLWDNAANNAAPSSNKDPLDNDSGQRTSLGDGLARTLAYVRGRDMLCQSLSRFSRFLLCLFHFLFLSSCPTFFSLCLSFSPSPSLSFLSLPLHLLSSFFLPLLTLCLHLFFFFIYIFVLVSLSHAPLPRYVKFSDVCFPKRHLFYSLRCVTGKINIH